MFIALFDKAFRSLRERVQKARWAYHLAPKVNCYATLKIDPQRPVPVRDMMPENTRWPRNDYE